MKNTYLEEILLCRALECALRLVPNKPRLDILTSDLAAGVIAAAERGVRDETALAHCALELVGIDPEH
jgi:hypothetical protein